ncbi:MAG: hypothetical protein IJH20_04390 [Bacilli bacterium]|nr:hypothetical protein [Bacilli bacterium]
MKKGIILDLKSINYNELNKNNILSLENNPKLLAKLISKDHNIYSLCSKEIKENYYFILELIELCKNDIDFIQKVGDEFLAIDLSNYDETEKNNKRIEKNAIIILLEKYTEFNGNYIKYHTMASTYYYSASNKITELINSLDNKSKERYGLGFGVHKNFFKNDIVLEHAALMMIDKIFNQLTNIERNLHNTYKSIDKVLSIGINNILINKIRSYDNYLADYILNHPSLVNKLNEKSDDIIDNWDEYNRQIKCSKDNSKKIVEQVKEYSNNYKKGFSIVSEIKFLIYFSKQYNIQENIYNYYKELNNGIDIDYFNFINNYDDVTLFIFDNIENIDVSDSFYTIFQIFEDNMEELCKNDDAKYIELEAGRLLYKKDQKNIERESIVKTRIFDFNLKRQNKLY